MKVIKIWFIEGSESGIIKAGYKTKKEAIEDLEGIKRFDKENGIDEQYYIDYEYIDYIESEVGK